MRKFYKLVSENRFSERQTRNRIIREDDILIDKNTDLREIVESNPTYKKIKSLCEKYNYRMKDGYKEKWDENSKDEYLRLALIKNWQDEFQPEIYVRGEEQKLEIQTTSYGALDINEYKEFLEKCEDAFELVEQINKLIPDLPTFIIKD